MQEPDLQATAALGYVVVYSYLGGLVSVHDDTFSLPVLSAQEW